MLKLLRVVLNNEQYFARTQENKMHHLTEVQTLMMLYMSHLAADG